MASSSLRRICSWCNQELSRSAFYRHQNVPVACPAQKVSPPVLDQKSNEATSSEFCRSYCSTDVLYDNDDAPIFAAAEKEELYVGDSADDLETSEISTEMADINSEEAEVILNDSLDDGMSPSLQQEQSTSNETQTILVRAIVFFLLFFFS